MSADFNADQLNNPKETIELFSNNKVKYGFFISISKYPNISQR